MRQLRDLRSTSHMICHFIYLHMSGHTLREPRVAPIMAFLRIANCAQSRSLVAQGAVVLMALLLALSMLQVAARQME